MQAHIVVAHPEPTSFNVHLADIARKTLNALGYEVSISDLYKMDFDPCEAATHYSDRKTPERFDTQAEQKNASDNGTIPDVIAAEIARMDAADLLILQYPMWWHMPPAMLKGWFDRVLVFGDVYASKKRFETGRFIGKQAMLSVTVGTSQNTYAYNGRSGDIDLMLWPVNFSLAYVGYKVLAPFVAYGVEGGLRYSEAHVVEAHLKDIETVYRETLSNLVGRREVPFNKMSEWGADGRIKPDAPALSPYVRHVESLKLNKT